MKTLQFITIVLVTALSVSATFGQVVGGPTVNPANGHTYYLLDANNWTICEAQAVGMGGHCIYLAADRDRLSYNAFSVRDIMWSCSA